MLLRIGHRASLFLGLLLVLPVTVASQMCLVVLVLAVDGLLHLVLSTSRFFSSSGVEMDGASIVIRRLTSPSSPSLVAQH